MSVRIENRCCGCAVPGYPCRGALCPDRHVEVHYCDHCDTELEDTYDGDYGEELCRDCYKELYEEE